MLLSSLLPLAARVSAAEDANTQAMRITFSVLLALGVIVYLVLYVRALRVDRRNMAAFEEGLTEAQEQVWADYGIRVTREQMERLTEHELTGVVALDAKRALRWDPAAQRVQLFDLSPTEGYSR